MRRIARQHETLRTQAGVQAEDYTDFRVRERVMTADGFAGRIEAVHDGPYPGSEAYDVKLDGGMGGGLYTASQLKKMADEEYTATKDYPELAEILVERPDPGKQVVLARKTAVTRQGREAKETRDYMDAQMRERGHDMDWKGVDLNAKGQSGHYVGECRNCGHSAVAGDNWSSSRGHVTTDARHSMCEGPGTAWKTEMVHELMHQRLNDAVGEFGQNVKNEQDKQWLRDQGIEARKKATTINDVKIDGHGDAPDEVRADDPNGYDKKSTEGEPDPLMSKPLTKRDEVGAHAGETMKAPGGVSFEGAMSPAQTQHIKDREDARQDVVDEHRQVNDARRDRTDVADIQRVEDPAYAKYLDRLSVLVVSADWNDPEEGLDHHRDHDWGGIDTGHGEGGEWHDPEEARCYYKHDGPCAELGSVEPKLPMGHTAMPSKKYPEPEGFNYHIVPTGTRYPGASTHVLESFLGNHNVGRLHFTKSDDSRAIKVDDLHAYDQMGHKGVASAMMDALYHEHPEAWINHGERTTQGLKWWSQYEDPAPERNVHHHAPSSGWDEYFHPRRVSLDMAQNYGYDPEHNPLPHNSSGYGEPERHSNGLPKDLHGPHWGQHHWAQGHDGERVFDDEDDDISVHAQRTEDEGDDLDDTLFPGGDASDRWFEKPQSIGFDLPGQGGRTIDDSERKEDAVQHSEPFPKKEHQLFSENAKTAHLILPPIEDEHSIADHLVNHHGFENDQIVNLIDPGQGDAATMAHELEHDNDPVSGEFGAGAIQESQVPHSHEGRWADRTHMQSLNSRLSDPYELVAGAATDAELRFHFMAAWSDVRAKAKRIRTEGKVRVTLATDGMVIGEVQGDHNTYETGIQRLPGQRLSVSGWSCGCKWGAYHWGAADDFSRFAGRMCSHALALQFEAQSRGMFGNVVEIDKTKPDWVPPRVVVKYNPDSGENRFVRSSAKHARPLDTPKQVFCLWALAQGESEEAIGLLLHTAAANDPWGEPMVETPPKPYGATSPRNPYESPASAGPLTAPDPDSWGHLDPSGMLVSSTLHDEPEAALPSTDGDLEDADLEPEDPSIQTMGNQIGGDDEDMDEARPQSDAEDDLDAIAKFQASAAAKALMNGGGGSGGGYSDSDIATRAMQTLALKAFSPAEQQALINEGMDVQASNLDRLDIAGTHYADVDEDEGDPGWMM